jgi:hypothetical protein
MSQLMIGPQRILNGKNTDFDVKIPQNRQTNL